MLRSMLNNDENSPVKREFSSSASPLPPSSSTATPSSIGGLDSIQRQYSLDIEKKPTTVRTSAQISDLLNNNSDDIVVDDEEPAANNNKNNASNDFTPLTGTLNKPKKKARRKSSSTDENKVLISTSSPEGIAAASEITPNRVANILLQEGPLPIRHLTGHLASQIPGFGQLSLSKQRRLIMAALEMGDPITSCIFEKIGWGQWEARKATPELIKARNTHSAATAAAAVINNPRDKSPENAIDSSTQYSSSAPKTLNSSSLSKRKERRGSSAVGLSVSPKNRGGIDSASYRRESITNSATDLHNTKVPTSPSLQPLQSIRNSFKERKYSLDEAIESSSSEYEDDDLDINNGGGSNDDDDGGLFTFEGDYNKAKQAMRSSSFSSTSGNGAGNRRPSFGGIVKPRKPRSSFTSHSIEAALDESMSLDDNLVVAGGAIPNTGSNNGKRRQKVSFSNPSSVSRQSFLRTNISPSSGPIMMNDHVSNVTIDRTPSSDNGQYQSQQLQHQQQQHQQQDNFTDEEDWEAIGAASLRRSTQASVVTPPTPSSVEQNYISTTTNNGSKPLTVQMVKPDLSVPLRPFGLLSATKSDEEIAAIALMDLKTI